MKVIRAEPVRVASWAPGRRLVMLARPGRAARLVEPSEVLRANTVEKAPIERFDNRFLQTMKSKGWLK